MPRFAIMASQARAKEHFAAGGDVCVSVNGEARFEVAESTVVHNTESTTWANLSATMQSYGDHRQRCYVVVDESNLHAHVETYATDCDGAISGTYVMTLSDTERAGQGEDNWFGDIHFHKRVVAHVVNTYAIRHEGHLTVRKLGDGDVRISWHEDTDEGFNRVEATFCTDECEQVSTYRDHAAEAAGY